MIRYLSRSLNKETGLITFKRLVVKEVNGLFYVRFQSDYGHGAGVSESSMPSIKPYKTAKGAEKAMNNWTSPQYKMSLYEGLVIEGRI